MVFKNDLVGHFVIWNNISKKRRWIFHFHFKFIEGPLRLSPKWAEIFFSEYEKSNLISQNGQSIPIWITPKTIRLCGKKSHSNCLDFVYSIIITLYNVQIVHAHICYTNNEKNLLILSRCKMIKSHNFVENLKIAIYNFEDDVILQKYLDSISYI